MLLENVVDEDGAPFFSLLKDELKGWDIQVTMGYRRYHDWLPSKYNQRHKYRNHGQSFVQWYRVARDRDGGRIGYGKDLYWAYSEIKKYFPSVSVINMHDSGDFMTNMYCDILPNATNSCAWQKHKAENETLHDMHANPSLPLWPIFIRSEAIRQSLIPSNISDLDEQIMKFADDMNYTLPFECLSAEEEQDILETSLRYEKEMVPDFFNSPLGKQELLKGFDEAVKGKKLCSVNTTHVLQDEQWLKFFSKQHQSMAIQK